MLETLAAFVLLVAFLASALRFALGLRAAKLAREAKRRAEEASGRRVVAEVTAPSGDLVLFLEDETRFYWRGRILGKRELLGVRLLLDGVAVRSVGLAIPPLGEGGALGHGHWGVTLHLRDGSVAEVPCGALREGVSREAAEAVYAAVARVIDGERSRP